MALAARVDGVRGQVDELVVLHLQRDPILRLVVWNKGKGKCHIFPSSSTIRWGEITLKYISRGKPFSFNKDRYEIIVSNLENFF